MHNELAEPDRRRAERRDRLHPRRRPPAHQRARRSMPPATSSSASTRSATPWAKAASPRRRSATTSAKIRPDQALVAVGVDLARRRRRSCRPDKAAWSRSRPSSCRAVRSGATPPPTCGRRARVRRATGRTDAPCRRASDISSRRRGPRPGRPVLCRQNSRRGCGAAPAGQDGQQILAVRRKGRVGRARRRRRAGSAGNPSSSSPGSRSCRPRSARPADDQGHADAAFEQLALHPGERPHVGEALAAIVAGEDDDRVAGDARADRARPSTLPTLRVERSGPSGA